MENMNAQVNSIVAGMRRRGINFVAIDFDLTLVSCHAGRADWDGTVQDLQDSVRPFFRAFVPEALEQGLHIAIVTFSTRVHAIEATLVGVFGDENARRIVVRGCDGRWLYVGDGCRAGKQAHMASAAAAIQEMNPDMEDLQITRRSTLLIDDFPENVEAALSNEVLAIRFNPDDEATTVNNIFNLFPYNSPIL